MKKIEFEDIEFQKLKELIPNFKSYYETEDEWSFQDLDNQREIAFEIVQILEDKVN